MKVLWLGDAGVSTGFSRVTHAIGERLVGMGHDVHVLATNYDGDYIETSLKLYRPTTLNPKDIYGQTRIVEMLGKVEPDVVVMLNDPQVIIQHLLRTTTTRRRSSSSTGQSSRTSLAMASTCRQCGQNCSRRSPKWSR